MPGPTTEILNEDLKGLRDDLHKSRLEIKDDINLVRSDFTNEVRRIDVSLAELKTQLTFSTRVAVWGVTIIAGSLVTSTFGGIWWASRINTKVDSLESRFEKLESNFEKLESKLEKLESKLDKLVSRFDKLDSSVAKILEQTRPK